MKPVIAAEPSRSLFRRPLFLDALLLLIAIGFGLPSLTYPFGGDQGLYSYIGREWLSGALPYRDTFDIKTPGIYVVHAIAHAIARDSMVVIRVFDLLVCVATGLLAAHAIANARVQAERTNGQTTRPPYGVCALAAAVVYFGFFDFWCSAQCEIWCCFFAALSLAVATQRPPARDWQVAIAAFAAGIVPLFKPPGALLVLPTFVVLGSVLLERPWRVGRLAKRVVVVAAAALAPLAILLGYYAAHGALGVLYEILIEQNRYYVKAGRTFTEPSQVVHGFVEGLYFFAPLLLVVALALGLGLKWALANRDKGTLLRFSLAAGLMLAAIAGVFSQLKFFFYHWGLLVLPVACSIAAVTIALAGRFGRRRATIVVASLTAMGFLSNAGAAHYLYREARNGYLGVTGQISPAEQESFFDFEKPFHFSWKQGRAVVSWLDEHTAPTDTVTFRGFNAQLYIAAHRRSTGRFFWTTFLVEKKYAMKRDEWLEEDDQVFFHDPPDFVVTYEPLHTGVDSAEFHIERYGYVPVAVIAEHVILQRPTERPAP